MSRDYITDDVLRIIGTRSDWVEACHAVEESEVRRFVQATMNPDPVHRDAARAAASRYGRPVAPPAFPYHAFRRPPDDMVDPLDRMQDPDFDGVSRTMRPGLPPVPVPLPGILNGGFAYEFYRYVHIGERILCRSRYQDIYQREGRSGVLVFVLVHDEYATGDEQPLLAVTNTVILH